MAALRNAARRLGELALQRSQRISPGRLPMSASSSIKGQTQPTIEMEKQLAQKKLEKRKQECEDFFQKMKRRPTDLMIIATNTDFRRSQPHDYGTAVRISFFGSLSLFVVSISLYVLQATIAKPRSSLKEQNNGMN